jgi:hypothetical protein
MILPFTLQFLNPSGDGSLVSFWDLKEGPGFKPSEVHLLSTLCFNELDLGLAMACCKVGLLVVLQKKNIIFIWHHLSP